MVGLSPPNVEGLQPVKINEILYQKLPLKAKINDQRLRGMNSYLLAGIGPLISILDGLIDFEASTKMLGDNDTLNLEDGVFASKTIKNRFEGNEKAHKQGSSDP